MWWEWLIVLAAVGIAGAWSARHVYRRVRQGARASCTTCEQQSPTCRPELVQLQPAPERGDPHAPGNRGEAES